jgi:hypothetical protein
VSIIPFHLVAQLRFIIRQDRVCLPGASDL